MSERAISPEMRQFMSAEQPEEKETDVEKYLGARYEELLAERRELATELKKFDVREFDAMVLEGSVDDETFKEIVGDWVERVRSKTDFLRATESIGIDIFAEDLKQQPGFLDHEIIFASDDIQKDLILKGQNIGGRAHVTRKIEVAGAEPTLKQRAASFLMMGKMPGSSEILVHELIHRYHKNNNPYTNRVLTEAHAYFGGQLSSGYGASVRQSAETLTQPTDEGGLYEYNADLSIEALSMVAELYGLGFKDDEIGNLIAESSFNPDTETFEPINSVLQEQRTSYGITEDEDAQALQDLARLHGNNERMKVQIQLFEAISERFSREQRLEIKKDVMRGIILYPSYTIDGRQVPARRYMQNVVTPISNKYPYEMNGQRTGITWGKYPDDGRTYSDDDDFKYRIGRWEATGSEGRVELAVSEEDEQVFLAELAEHSKGLDANHIMDNLKEYMNYGLDSQSELAKKVMKALLSTPEKRQEVTKKLFNGFGPGLDMVNGQIDGYLSWGTANMVEALANVKRHENNLKRLVGLSEKLELLLEEACPDIENKLKLLQINIETFNDMYVEPQEDRAEEDLVIAS